MLLGDLGAEVIKIENRIMGDDTRAFYPIKNGESGYFNYLNRSKKSLTLDLKSEKGKAIALELAKWADIVVENFSPGTIGRLGLGYEDIKKVNLEIIYVSISGFGQTGPYRNKAAYDGVAQAMGGMTYMTGLPDGPPVKAGPAISDAATGVHAAMGILAAQYYKNQTGKGQYIDIALMDTVFSILENSVSIHTLLGLDPLRIGNANPSSAPYNMYKSKDSYIVIATANDSLFSRLCKVMDQEELITEPFFNTNPNRKTNQAEIDAIVNEWTQQYTSKELEKMLDDVGVPVASVKTIAELAQDPHIQHREMLVTHYNPNVGCVRYPGNPLKLSETPADTSRRAPLLGEHSTEILASKLHLSVQDIEKLREENVI